MWPDASEYAAFARASHGSHARASPMRLNDAQSYAGDDANLTLGNLPIKKNSYTSIFNNILINVYVTYISGQIEHSIIFLKKEFLL